MAADVFEAEDFSNLTHWQSLAWHGAPPDHWRDTVPSVNDCSRTALPPAPQGWLECLGITGWFASEYARMALAVRTIGIARAQVKIGLANLAYNIRRMVWLSGKILPA